MAMRLCGDGVDDADPALRMPDNSDLVKVHLLIENALCIPDRLIVVQPFQVPQAHLGAKAIPRIHFFRANNNEAPGSIVRRHRGVLR